MKYIIPLLLTCSFLLVWDRAFSETIDTGNILSNSTFGTGTTYSTTGWTVDEHTHGHHGTGSFGTLGGGNNPGGSVAAEENTSIEQTITLSEKTNMTTQEIQNGWSSTLSADIWYWNQYDNTTTLKQTITGSDGSVSTQQRVIQDTGCGSINCGSFTNYTDTHIQGSNTQTDFDIKVGVTNTNNRSGHWGPDIDDVELKIQYTYINPISDDSQDVIDDIDETIDDAIDDIDWEEDYTWNDTWYEEEYTWYEEDYSWENEFYFEDEYAVGESDYFENDFYFDEELETIDLDMVDFEEQPIFENFEEFETFEEMPIIEEVFFEEDYTMEPPPMMTEEIFTEEFEEDFTEFLEETGMEEEFTQFLEEEGITAEEFFEEITEEEFNEELTEESFEEFEEEFTESPTIEESPQEVVENEEEEVGSEPEIEEEQELAQNESTTESESNEPETNQEEESSSESSEESDVQTESSEEQEDIQSEDREEMDTEDRIVTDVARAETKLKENLKKIAKQIAQVTKQNTQNLSKEDIFFKQNNSFEEYKNQTFYSARSIYEDVTMGLFLQVDLSPYTGDIYLGTTLNSYIQDDPVEIHRVKLLNIQKTKNKLLAELEALKQ